MLPNFTHDINNTLTHFTFTEAIYHVSREQRTKRKKNQMYAVKFILSYIIYGFIYFSLVEADTIALITQTKPLLRVDKYSKYMYIGRQF